MGRGGLLAKERPPVWKFVVATYVSYVYFKCSRLVCNVAYICRANTRRKARGTFSSFPAYPVARGICAVAARAVKPTKPMCMHFFLLTCPFQRRLILLSAPTCLPSLMVSCSSGHVSSSTAHASAGQSQWIAFKRVTQRLLPLSHFPAPWHNGNVPCSLRHIKDESRHLHTFCLHRVYVAHPSVAPYNGTLDKIYQFHLMSVASRCHALCNATTKDKERRKREKEGRCITLGDPAVPAVPTCWRDSRGLERDSASLRHQ